MKTLPLFTQPQVILDPYDLLSSVGHKMGNFEDCTGCSFACKYNIFERGLENSSFKKIFKSTMKYQKVVHLTIWIGHQSGLFKVLWSLLKLFVTRKCKLLSTDNINRYNRSQSWTQNQNQSDVWMNHSDSNWINNSLKRSDSKKYIHISVIALQ